MSGQPSSTGKPSSHPFYTRQEVITMGGSHEHKKGNTNVNGKTVKQPPQSSKNFKGGSNVHSDGRGQSGQPKK